MRFIITEYLFKKQWASFSAAEILPLWLIFDGQKGWRNQIKWTKFFYTTVVKKRWAFEKKHPQIGGTPP